MKKSVIMFLSIGITLIVLSVFYVYIAGLFNCDRESLNSEQLIIRLWGVMLVLSATVMHLFKKYMSENLRPITGILALMMSATVSMAIYSYGVQWAISMFGDKRPFANPISFILLIISVTLFIILLSIYYFVRKKKSINTETLIDIVIVFAYLIPFFLTYALIHSILSDWLAVYYQNIG